MGRKERLEYWRKLRGSVLGTGYSKQKFVPEGNPHHALCKKIRREEEKAIEEALEKYGIPDRIYVDKGLLVQRTKEKKLMTMDDENEFIDQVIALAKKKSMTISNIIDAVEKVVAYMEDNATLEEGPLDNSSPSECLDSMNSEELCNITTDSADGETAGIDVYYEDLINNRIPARNGEEKAIQGITLKDAGVVLVMIGMEHPASKVVFKYLVKQKLKQYENSRCYLLNRWRFT